MGQPISRLYAFFGTFIPFGERPTNRATARNGTELHERGGRRSTTELSGDELSTHGRVSGAGGRGSPNNGNGSYFGSHFLMGGELYDTAKPEVFLFGDQQDLELLDNKPVKFPHYAKGVTDSVGVLNALVNVRRDSVKFTKIGRSGGGYSSGFYRIEFILDCDVSCFVQIHFCARESIDEQFAHHVRIVSRNSQIEPSERFHFPVGANQQFSHFTFKPHRYDMKLMQWDGGSNFPVVIEIRSVSDQYPEQVQTTLCSIERSTDQSATLILKPLKQKLISSGVVFLLQEIFGIENKENAEIAPLAEENSAECIICMANPRDTMILPCRHLCICNGCAETLRYKLNNCPICRSPFKALLKVRAMRNSLVGHGVGSDGNVTTTRIRREPLTLVEAINGPFSSASHSNVHGYDANNKTDIVAKCKGNNIVTTTTTALPFLSSSPPQAFSYSLPFASNERAYQTESGVLSTSGDHRFGRNSDQCSHSSFIRRSPNNSISSSRSPSLCRATLHRHSNSSLSIPNSSYQSARSILQKGKEVVRGKLDEDEQKEDGRGAEAPLWQPSMMQTSAPNLTGAGSYDPQQIEAVVEIEAIELEAEEAKLATKKGTQKYGGHHGKRKSEPAASLGRDASLIRRAETSSMGNRARSMNPKKTSISGGK